MRKRAARVLPTPAALKDPTIRKKIKRLKEAQSKIWDDNQIKAEITKVKEQQKRLGTLLIDLRKIEHGVSRKKTKR